MPSRASCCSPPSGPSSFYGDVVGAALIVGMYGRRYSPLSVGAVAEPAREVKDAASDAAPESRARHQRARSELASTKHHKTLDDMINMLKEFTGRCNVFMEPLLEMTDFLGTQRTPTSATTKSALTALFVRLVVITPFWLALTMPPWCVITTRRVVLVAGTVVLTWRARVMRVSRTILWRSVTVRRLAAATTGLRFDAPAKGLARLASRSTLAASKPHPSARANGRRNKGSGVKFTFILYENQRRWVGLGWTASLFAYERAAWTDEHNNAAPQRDDFALPDVDDGSRTRWHWTEGSRWRVDDVPDDHGPVDYDGEEGKNGWIYYDNKWQNGRRAQDGWAKWTRRRKWYRDAELVEVDESDLPQQPDVVLTKANGSASGLHTERYSTAGEKMVMPVPADASPGPIRRWPTIPAQKWPTTRRRCIRRPSFPSGRRRSGDAPRSGHGRRRTRTLRGD